MPMQIRRTATPNNPPTALAEGQLAVEMATPLRLWCGVPTTVDPTGLKLLVPTPPESPVGLDPTRPATPNAGELWFDTSTDLLEMWDGAQWVVINPVPAAPPDVSTVPVGGQLRIVGGSPATQIRYYPFNGGWVRINGTDYPLPAVGVTAGLTGVYIDGVAGQNLAINTLYFVYLFSNAGVLTMDFSTISHETSPTAGNVGVEVKQGDNSRTLIGVVHTGNPVGFRDDLVNRLVRSWLNRPTKAFDSGFQTSLSGTPATAWNNSNAVFNLVSFANEAVSMTMYGVWNASGNVYLVLAPFIDGSVSGSGAGATIFGPGFWGPATYAAAVVLTEGRHQIVAAINLDAAGAWAVGNCSVVGTY